MVNPHHQRPNEKIPEELLEVSQEFWQQHHAQQQSPQPSAKRQRTPCYQEEPEQGVVNPQSSQPQQQYYQSQQNRNYQQPMDTNSNKTVDTIRLVSQSPGELKSLAKQSKLTQQLLKLQNRSSNSFEEDLADGARAAGQTGRIVVENANPFTGPVRAYSYISLIVTTAGLIVGVLYIAGGLGSKVANNVKVQVRYGQEQPATTPSRLTTGRGNPPVVDWVPGGR